MEGTHMAPANQYQVFRSYHQRTAPLPPGSGRLFHLHKVRAQQLLQIGHRGPLPRNAKHHALRRHVFPDRSAAGGAELLDGITLAGYLMQLSVHALLVRGD
jgi:hypothetical protein